MPAYYMAVSWDSIMNFDNDETGCALYCIEAGMAFVVYYPSWAESCGNGWFVTDCTAVDLSTQE